MLSNIYRNTSVQRFHFFIAATRQHTLLTAKAYLPSNDYWYKKVDNENMFKTNVQVIKLYETDRL